MGAIVQNIYDPNNPRAQGMIQYMSRGNTPFLVCAYGDLVAAYQCAVAQNARRQQREAPTVTVRSVQQLPANQYETQVVLLSAETNFNDGKGPMTSSVRLGSFQEGPQGGWALTISAVHVPKQLSDQEWPTMRAIAASYRQNGQVIQQQTNQVIADIHARAAVNTKIAEERSRENDQHNADVEARWDDQAKQNKAFENYTLDRAVVQDNDVPAHGTFTYPTADFLVKTDPDRFQYVPTQDLVKGVDY